jgi:hypothetical protein
MADNIDIKDASGATITVGSDQVAGIQYPRHKLVWGADGTVNDASASNPLPVTAATLPLPTGAATAAKQPALGTAGSASTDVITVQGIASGVAQAANITQVAGSTVAQGHGVAATAIRVELPTDGTGVVGLATGANTIGAVNIAAAQTLATVTTVGAVTAITNALPAGTNVIGKVTTDQTTHGTTDLVAADITKVAGAAIAQGHGVAATAIRVELPTDGTGIVGLATGANTIGAVNIASGQTLASVTTVSTVTAVTAITNALPAGTNVIGKFSIDQTTPGTTNAVDTELPAAAALSDTLANPTTPQVGADLLAWDGSQWVRVRTASTYKDQSTVAIGSIATVWTPASGKKFRLMGGSISVSAAGSILFEDNTGGNTVFRTPKLAADTPYNFDLPGGKLSATANNVLKATLSTTGNLTGTLWGTEE